MIIEVQYFKRRKGSKNVGCIEHITLTEDEILSLAASTVEEDDWEERYNFSIDKVIHD